MRMHVHVHVHACTHAAVRLVRVDSLSALLLCNLPPPCTVCCCVFSHNVVPISAFHDGISGAQFG